MEYKNPLTVSLERSFIAGTGDLAAFHNRLNKLDCAVILFCRSGWAQITIDLRKYEIVKNTQIVLLPGTVISLDGKATTSTFLFSLPMAKCFGKPVCDSTRPSFIT